MVPAWPIAVFAVDDLGLLRAWRRQEVEAAASSCSSQVNIPVSTTLRQRSLKNKQKAWFTTTIFCEASVMAMTSTDARGSVSKKRTVCRVAETELRQLGEKLASLG
jgi:hypothetical protein